MSGIMAMMLGAFPSELTDPYFANTVLLLHGDGTNAAQNNTFLDSSSNNFTITRNGNPTQGTFSPFSKEEGKWGAYFDGTGDYLTVPDNAAFAFGSGDWTIEAWFCKTSTTSGALIGYGGSGTSNACVMIYVANTTCNYYISTTGTTWNIASGKAFGVSIAQNTWHHLALVRSGNTITPYIDGVAGTGTSTISASMYDSSDVLYVGGTNYAAGGNEVFTGYISNFRIVKGTAVYTGNFTPSTTPLTAITNTSLLCCQSNRFKDNSSNAFAITAAGNVAVTPFSPFANSAAYSAATNGGSGYFDGDGDYLSLADNASLDLDAGDFTLEAWVYFPTATNVNYIMHKGWGAAGGWGMWGQNTFRIRMYDGAGVNTTATSSATLVSNAWNHVAATRSGNTLTVYVNGVSSGTASYSGTSTNASTAEIAGNSGFASYATGYISGLRLIKGSVVYTGNFTPPTSPLTAITNTQLLTNFTNAGIIDNTGFNDLETVGNAQISTSVKKYGTGSLAFDGTGDYLVVPYSSNLDFRTGNFTLEFWFYNTSIATTQLVLDGRNSATNGAFPCVAVDTSKITWFVSGSNRIQTSALSNSTWYHIAIVRNSGTTALYLDGTSQGTWADSTDYIIEGSSRLVIGAGGYSLGALPMFGNIDDLRITKGYARYTANFTPPAQAFPDK